MTTTLRFGNSVIICNKRLQVSLSDINSIGLLAKPRLALLDIL